MVVKNIKVSQYGYGDSGFTFSSNCPDDVTFSQDGNWYTLTKNGYDVSLSNVSPYNAVSARTSEITPVVTGTSCTSKTVILEQLNYLEFVAIDNCQFKFSGVGSVEYSTNSGQTWNTLPNSSFLGAVAGTVVLWRGELTPIDGEGIGTFGGTTGGRFIAKGNPMSLIEKDDFIDSDSVSDYAFRRLFYLCSGLTSAENISLPMTVLGIECYEEMFSNCTSLTSVPRLPALVMEEYCYFGMFSGCESLTTVPLDLLPSTELTTECYYDMFNGCTSLTTVPNLPATTLAEGCYSYMFTDCTSLTTVPSSLLPSTTLAPQCYENMFNGCTSLTTVPNLPATTLADYCYGDMFSFCSGLTTVPSDLLPATELEYCCYSYMFCHCTSLEIAPELPATTLAEKCYSNMFENCISLKSYIDGEVGTVGEADKRIVLPATELYIDCYYAMFNGCNSAYFTHAPILSAETLEENCYRSMFQNCSNLRDIVCLATDISAANATTGWVLGVASFGSFEMALGMYDAWSQLSNGDGIPDNWAYIDPSL